MKDKKKRLRGYKKEWIKTMKKKDTPFYLRTIRVSVHIDKKYSNDRSLRDTHTRYAHKLSSRGKSKMYTNFVLAWNSIVWSTSCLVLASVPTSARLTWPDTQNSALSCIQEKVPKEEIPLLSVLSRTEHCLLFSLFVCSLVCAIVISSRDSLQLQASDLKIHSSANTI